MKSFYSRAFSSNVLMAVTAGLILLAITIGSYVFGDQVTRNSVSALQAGAADRAVGRLLEALLDAETGQRGFLLTQDTAYLKPYYEAKDRFATEIETFRRETQNLPALADQPEYQELLRLAEQKFTELEHTVTLAQSGDTAGALAVVRGGVGVALMDKIRTFADNLNAATTRQRLHFVADMRSSANNFTLLMTIGVIAVVLVSLISIRLVAINTRTLETARIALANANEGLEARVAERTKGLARANDEIQRYAYIVSHDLRAPLVNIIGFTSELATATATLTEFLDRIELDRADPMAEQAIAAAKEDIPEALEFIRSSSVRMDGLINEILKLSRLGRITLSPAKVDMTAVLTDCIANIQHRLDVEEATAEIAKPLPTVVSDLSSLQQIFGNILDNAVKYFDARRPGRITIRGKRTGTFVTFEVEDNGRGIAPTDHERIFELFRRSGVQDRPGEGIGLAHVRTLVRRLGGDITVESDGHSGTLFRITIISDLREHLRSQTT
jgi:signal transduction histidine kinase